MKSAYSDDVTGPQQAVLAAFVQWGGRVFPVRLTREADGVSKKPLTRHGHLDASADPSVFDWRGANGFGVAMGGRLYALDLDHYKPGCEAEGWLLKQGLGPILTRSHGTPSGGVHRIWLLPPGEEDLPSRQAIVPGLDSRGLGGWIAFGEGYEVIHDRLPAHLPKSACAAIRAGYTGSLSRGGAQVVRLHAYQPPEDVEGVEARWIEARTRGQAMRRRANGVKLKGDPTRSARDHSLAYLLALMKWKEPNIVYCLLHLYEHGAARWAKHPAVGLRAAQRSAAKALVDAARMANLDAEVDALNTPQAHAAAEAALSED